MENDGITGFFIGFLIGAVLVIAIFSLFLTTRFWGDEGDKIDTRALGEMMCEDQGLEYSHRELVNEDPKDMRYNVPIIYCKSIDKQIGHYRYLRII